MSLKSDDRRRHPRTIFSTKEKILVAFQIADSDKTIEGNFMNLSLAGLSASVERSNSKLLQEGTRLVLKEVSGFEPLKFMADLEMKIVWTLDNNYLASVGFGCEFISMQPDLEEKIRQFIASRNPSSTA